MIVTSLYRLLWLVALLALQVLVLDHLHFYGIASAVAIPWFVMLYPQGTGRVQSQLWAFALGLLCDIFAGTPGLQTASMTLIGLLQPPLLKIYTPKDAVEGFTPSFSTLGTWAYMRYAAVLLLLHHALYFALDAFSFSRLYDSAVRIACSFVLSYVVILCLEHLRHHK